MPNTNMTSLELKRLEEALVGVDQKLERIQQTATSCLELCDHLIAEQRKLWAELNKGSEQ